MSLIYINIDYYNNHYCFLRFSISIQETEFGEETKKFRAIVIEKEKELEELKRVVTSKDTQINELKENFLNEKMEIKKEVWRKLLILRGDLDYSGSLSIQTRWYVIQLTTSKKKNKSIKFLFLKLYHIFIVWSRNGRIESSTS